MSEITCTWKCSLSFESSAVAIKNVGIWKSESNRKYVSRCLCVPFFFFPVPSMVRNIHVSPNGMTNSLKVSWTPGSGDVDSYTVTIFQQNHQLDSQSVSKHVSEHMFHKLEAGEQYRVVVQSNSGTLHNSLAAFGRTSTFLLRQGQDALNLPRSWTVLIMFMNILLGVGILRFMASFFPKACESLLLQAPRHGSVNNRSGMSVALPGWMYVECKSPAQSAFTGCMQFHRRSGLCLYPPDTYLQGSI